jgi:hypothetical protein
VSKLLGLRETFALLLLLLLLLLSIAAAGCTGTSSSDDAGIDAAAMDNSVPRCVPGASAACACSDGSNGAQVCAPDGTFGPCQCNGNVDAGMDAVAVDVNASDSEISEASIHDVVGMDVSVVDVVGVDVFEMDVQPTDGSISDTMLSDAHDAADSSPACDASICNEQCVNTQDDVRHCGACGNDCTALPGVVPTAVRCVEGVCDVATACAPNRANCSDLPADGCETDLSGVENCGRCGNACPRPTSGDAVCVSGACRVICEAGYTTCGSACVEVHSDAQNCGRCGNICAPYHVCASGVCECEPGPGTLDQAQLNAPGGFMGSAISNRAAIGQTLTVGRSGALSAIEVSLCRSSEPAPLTMTVYDASGAVMGAVTRPSDEVVGSDCGPLSATSNGAGMFDFSQLCLLVREGEMLRFELTLPPALAGSCNVLTGTCLGTLAGCFNDVMCNPSVYIGEVVTDAYAGGSATFRGDPQPDWDLTFKVLIR